jgi:hypothetical protein
VYPTSVIPILPVLPNNNNNNYNIKNSPVSLWSNSNSDGTILEKYPDFAYTSLKKEYIPFSDGAPPKNPITNKKQFYDDDDENNNNNKNNDPIDSLKRNIIEDIMSAIQDTKDNQTNFEEEIKSIKNYQQGNSNRNDEKKQFLTHAKVTIRAIKKKLKTNEAKKKLQLLSMTLN